MLGQLEFLKHVFRFRPRVYLDHNATTSVSSHVRRTMNRALKNYYGNPSSLYRIATKSDGIIEQARHRVAYKTEYVYSDRRSLHSSWRAHYFFWKFELKDLSLLKTSSAF